MDARGGASHARPKDVSLDGVAADRHHESQQADERPFEDESDHDRQPHPDRCADQRQELEEESQNSEDDRVGDSDDRHGDAGIGPHDQRHGQLTARVLPERRAYRNQDEVEDLLAPDHQLAHAGDQHPALDQQVDRDDEHEQDVDQRAQRPAEDAEDRSKDRTADRIGPGGQAQFERNARAVDRVLYRANETKRSRFQRRQLLGLVDQGRGDQGDQPRDNADDHDVKEQHREDAPPFEDGEPFHRVDNRGEQHGDDGGEDEQQEDVEEVNDQVLALVKEHHGRKRDQEVDQDLDRPLQVAPAPDQGVALLALSHEGSFAGAASAARTGCLTPRRGTHVPVGPIAQLEKSGPDRVAALS